MSSAASQVLIVGSGPTGLILGLSLLRNGIPVRIIEKDPQHQPGIFRGSGIVPRTLEVEYFLGVLDDVKKAAIDPPLINIYDQADPYRVIKTQNLVQEVEPTPAFPITHVAILGQYRHQTILLKHFEERGGKVEFGSEFAGLHQDEAGVTVTIKKTSGESETTKFAYVIGADGGRSAVRKSLNIEFVGETRDFAVFLADARIEGFDGKGIHKWGEPQKNVAQLDWHGEPQMYQILGAGPWFDIKGVMADSSIERLQAEFTKCVPRQDIKIVEIFSKSEWRPNIRLATRFRSGRVFLAGDAAHTHPPTGGQGLNSSIMDAFNLGWKLALALKGQADLSILDTYEAERMPVIAEMLKISTSILNATVGATHDALRRVEEAQLVAKQNEAAKKDENAPFTRGWKLFQLDLNYRFSPAVLDERVESLGRETGASAYGVEGHDIRVGDRAPDAPGLRPLAGSASATVKPTRLFEIFEPTAHTALIFAPTTSEADTQSYTNAVLGALQAHPSRLVRTVLVLPSAQELRQSLPGVEFIVEDAEGHAFKNYGLTPETPHVVLVRPDDFVGAFVKGAEGVSKYLQLVFGKVGSS